MDDAQLAFLRTKLKNGEYDGVDIMHAWLAIDELRQVRAELDGLVEDYRIGLLQSTDGTGYITRLNRLKEQSNG